ncbi:MAG: hypothetical protein JW883_09710, partial [Deltaproteobacteria bacterium]|nr:hypothetical protein [Deltaproteobacteria bacterium]
MKRSVVISVVLVLSLIIGISSALAVEVTLFGPKQYVRTSGSPDVFADTFVGVPGQGTLIVKNGNYDGGHRVEDGVSSATMSVNGLEIFGPNDFNQNVYYLETTVDLIEDNTVDITLASALGSYITVEVTE